MQEKYLRMHACKNILLEIPSFKSVNFQKNTSVLHRYQRKTENSAFTLQGMLQRKSRNISVVVVTNFWWLIQSPDEVQTFGTWKFQKERTYCTISRLKLFMYKLCKLRFFFWSNIEISFTFYNNSRTCFESWG